MESLLNLIEIVGQAGALGFVAYGLWLCLIADPRIIKAARNARGDGVLPSRPANLVTAN